MYAAVPDTANALMKLKPLMLPPSLPLTNQNQSPSLCLPHGRQQTKAPHTAALAAANCPRSPTLTAITLASAVPNSAVRATANRLQSPSAVAIAAVAPDAADSLASVAISAVAPEAADALAAATASVEQTLPTPLLSLPSSPLYTRRR